MIDKLKNYKFTSTTLALGFLYLFVVNFVLEANDLSKTAISEIPGSDEYVESKEETEKKNLNPEDYAQWQRIGVAELSPDANWFAWNIHQIEGDGWLMLQKTGEDPDEGHRFDHAQRPAFSNDNQWFTFMIGASEEERRQNQNIRYSLGLMNLETAEVDTFSNISRSVFSDDGKFLVMNKYRPEGSDHRGSDIILRDLQTGNNQLIGNVANFLFNEESTMLAYLVDSHEKLGNGVHLIDLETRSTRVLESDEADYEMLTWNEQGTGLAFLKAFEEEDYEEKSYQIYVFRNLDGNSQKQVFDSLERDDFPEEFRLVNYRNLRWSDDGDRIFFGIKEWTKKDEDKEEEKADPDEEKEEGEEEEAEENQEDPDAHLDPTNVEVWHWLDDPMQSRQRVMRQNLKESNFLSVWHLNDDRFIQLTDDHEVTLSLTGDQKHAVLNDPKPHKPRMRELWNDIYLVDVSTGEQELVMERQEWVFPSAGGSYLLYFRENHWWTYDIEGKNHINLTEDLEHPFNNFRNITGREFDSAFGRGQWAEDDQWVLLYDEFDVYKVAPDGSTAERITDGREDEIRYRQQRLDFEIDAINPDEPFYLNIFGERTKNRGYARVMHGGEVEELIYEPASISRLMKAEDTPNYSYLHQTAVDSPNFYLVIDDFENPVRLTNTNPQQDEYHWAGDELISFTNQRGEELEGRLLYPADYDPDKQYPMVVYIYERVSQSLHNYALPSRTSAYNQRRFSSEGYFVFMPDITYELNRPGMSAVESVVPAVEKVLETGMIDPDRIGLTGHSWGGYQTNFIITQSDLFSSAVAGAPLVNLISMYNSIYWSSGFHQGYIFETSQGRFPYPWWEDKESFLENSPLHQIENSETPLLLMFGTDDGAVPFNQGVELYTTMRRMHKEFVMLVYDGEGHGLGRRENQIDYANRAMQWHAHYLLGEEPESWIIEGLPFIERPEVKD